MDLYLDDDIADIADPLDLVEAVFSDDDRFAVERGEDGDVHFSLARNWADVAGYVAYRAELPALLFTLGFDMRAPTGRIPEAVRLAAMINENLWLGHFDVWTDDGSIVFRHSIPMIGREEVSVGEVQALLAAILDAAERFHPAFQFLLHAGATAEEASAAAMFETAGEA
ncbi:MAG: hypothetical protein GC206_03965 [Alphaproteobacteria bacterium]|nr:hypothetical protein [Alphaproteobacteria bacterium]